MAHAERKARGWFSRLTKKPVAESMEEQVIEGRLMQVASIRFNLIGPPRLAPERVRRLARMHLQAFFYFITYDHEKQLGGFIPGDIGHLAEVSRSDSGNPHIRGFADLTWTWDTRVCGGGANGYFRIAIRRAPIDAALWSYALEWNAALRVVGFFGDLVAAQTFVDGLPELEWKRFDETRRYREEIALDPAQDCLFKNAELPKSSP